ncbi:MAG: O-antigen/teichoic acid export membrane protein [Bacteroidia bacterium]|jgi:O-antigen/teichoic acid export membrane protein
MTSHGRRDLTGLADQAVVSGGTLLTTMLFIRGAGMEEFGILSLVWLAMLFGTAVQHSAVIAPAYALFPKLTASEAPGFRGYLVLIQLVFGALLLGVLTASWYAPGFSLLPKSPGLLPALVFLGARQAFTFLRLQLFVAESGPRRALMVDVVHVVASVAGLVVLDLGDKLDARSGLLVLGAASAGAALMAVPAFVQLGCSFALPARALRVRHMHFSKWLVGKALAQWFTANSFLVALGTIQGPVALGAVRAAQTLVGVAGVVIQGFENLVPARAAAVFGQQGSAGLGTFLRTSMPRWFSYLSICLLPIVVFPGFFLKLLTGAEQAGLEEPLFFFAFGALLALAILYLQVCLRAVERVGVLFWAQLASGMVGAVAAVPMVMAFGLRGCMVGIIVQQLVVLCLLLRPARACLRAEAPVESGKAVGRVARPEPQ